MVIPAAFRKLEIDDAVQKLYYTTDVFYLTGGDYRYLPQIAFDPPSALDGVILYQYAIVDSNDKLLGLFCYQYDLFPNTARNLFMVSFDRGNPLFGIEVKKLMTGIINKSHRIIWNAVADNPAVKHYDKLCEKYNGTKHVFHDAVRDANRQYHDDIWYEIINPNV